MLIVVVRTTSAVARKGADAFQREAKSVLERNEVFIVVLPTGSTPIQMYEEISRRYRDGEIARELVSRTRTWNLDEYLPPTDREKWRNHEQSYRRFMEEHLFRHLPFADGANRLPDPAAPDLPAHCREYDDSLAALGGPHVVYVGIGENAHVAFNEPLSWKDSPTRVVDLAQTTIVVNAKKFFDGNLNAVPKQAISMGFKPILSARKVILLATGYAKAVAVAASVLGPATGWCPASFFQEHSDCTYLLDAEAASLLLREGVRRDGPPAPGTYTVKSESGIEHTIEIPEALSL